MVCIVDGTVRGAYEDVTNIVFSPSGTHWAVLAKKNGKYQFVVDGVEHGTYEEVCKETRVAFTGDDELYAIVKEDNAIQKITVRAISQNP